jgi:hypothetical protein
MESMVSIVEYHERMRAATAAQPTDEAVTFAWETYRTHDPLRKGWLNEPPVSEYTEVWHYRECLRTTYSRSSFADRDICRLIPNFNKFDPKFGFPCLTPFVIDEPHQIIFTPDDSYGKRDRTVTMKFGRYLKRIDPSLDDDYVRIAVNKFNAIYGVFELKFAETEEEIEHVYVDGNAGSCMAAEPDEWGMSVHPARVYAGPDTCVAYASAPSGEIVARGVINKINNTYCALYGNDGVLEELLRNAGYSIGDGLEGCRLKVVYDEAVDGYCMPYLDGNVVGLTITKDYLIVDNNLDECECGCDEDECECDEWGDTEPDPDVWASSESEPWIYSSTYRAYAGVSRR